MGSNVGVVEDRVPDFLVSDELGDDDRKNEPDGQHEKLPGTDECNNLGKKGVASPCREGDHGSENSGHDVGPECVVSREMVEVPVAFPHEHREDAKADEHQCVRQRFPVRGLNEVGKSSRQKNGRLRFFDKSALDDVLVEIDFAKDHRKHDAGEDGGCQEDNSHAEQIEEVGFCAVHAVNANSFNSDFQGVAGSGSHAVVESGQMARFIFKRLLQLIPTLLGVTLLTFLLFNVLGTSPAMQVLGKNATPEAIAEYDHLHGYDRPLVIQYVSYLADLCVGDFGESLEYREPVWNVLRSGVGVSLALTVPILLLGTVLALLVGLLCAARAGGLLDRTMLGCTTALMSINYVIWVAAGQYFLAFRWNLFPLWGFENWTYLLLPILIGIVSSLGSDARFYRTVILDEIRKPSVRTALAKGLSPARILFGHVLRNSLIPVVTNVSLAVPFLFTGSILLESFYGIPGLGGIGLNAVNASDYATVRAVVVIGALLYQLSNLAADLLNAWLDPAVRLRT